MLRNGRPESAGTSGRIGAENAIGDYRVFYEIREERIVRVLSVGHKEHNMLFIRGRRVEI